MYVWMYVFLAKSKSPLKREKCFPKKRNTHKTKHTDTQTHRHHHHTHNLKENKQSPIIDLQPSLLLLLLLLIQS
jgi:hypothetical protein